MRHRTTAWWGRGDGASPESPRRDRIVVARRWQFPLSRPDAFANFPDEGRHGSSKDTLVGMGVACTGLGDPVGDALRARARYRRGCGSGPDRHRVRGRLSRRGGRAPHRRAVRHAGPGRRRDGHRGGADRLRHGCGSGGQGGAGARHGLRRRHDRLQRHRRRCACSGAARAITSRDFSSTARAPRWPCWPRSPRSR